LRIEPRSVAVKENVTKDETAALKKKLEDAGATVELK
jgi:ribosomal protein L7/L12